MTKAVILIATLLYVLPAIAADQIVTTKTPGGDTVGRHKDSGVACTDAYAVKVILEHSSFSVPSSNPQVSVENLQCHEGAEFSCSWDNQSAPPPVSAPDVQCLIQRLYRHHGINPKTVGSNKDYPPLEVDCKHPDKRGVKPMACGVRILKMPNQDTSTYTKDGAEIYMPPAQGQDSRSDQ
jgi:hypothetical protein